MTAPQGEPVRTMRYFIDGVETDEDTAKRAEARGIATVSQGGSGVVPQRLRSARETEENYLRPWVELLSTRPAKGGES